MTDLSISDQERRARAALMARSVAGRRAVLSPASRGRAHFDASGHVVILAAPLPRPRPAIDQESQPGAARIDASARESHQEDSQPVDARESHQEQERPASQDGQESQPGCARIDATAPAAVIDADSASATRESHQEDSQPASLASLSDQERRAALLVRLAVDTAATSREDRRASDRAARLLLSLVAPAQRAAVRPRHNERVERIAVDSAAGRLSVTFWPLPGVGTKPESRFVILSADDTGLFTVTAEVHVPIPTSR